MYKDAKNRHHRLAGLNMNLIEHHPSSSSSRFSHRMTARGPPLPGLIFFYLEPKILRAGHLKLPNPEISRNQTGIRVIILA